MLKGWPPSGLTQSTTGSRHIGMEYGRICGPVAGMSPDYKPALRRGIGQRVGRLIRLVIDFITTSIEVLQSKHSSHMVVPPP